MGDEIIDTSTYPLDDLESPAARELIERVRAGLDEDGSCTLPGFVAPEILKQMADEAQRIAHLAYPGPTEVSPYFFNYRLGEGQALPGDHPLRRKGKRNLAQVAADLIPA